MLWEVQEEYHQNHAALVNLKYNKNDIFKRNYKVRHEWGEIKMALKSSKMELETNIRDKNTCLTETTTASVLSEDVSGVKCRFSFYRIK